MQEQAGERTYRRGVLNSGQTVEPVEKALNRLANGTDKGRKSIAGNQGILIGFFPWRKEFNCVVLFERSFPGGVDVRSSTNRGKSVI